MANNIKGITVEIGGNTGPLNSALKDVNKSANDAQSELKEVNKQLKFDPKNVTLTSQKIDLLKQKEQALEEKQKTLKTAVDQAHAAFEKGDLGADKVRAVEREYEKVNSQLKDTKKDLAAAESATGSFTEKVKGKFSELKDKVKDAFSAENIKTAVGAIGAAVGGFLKSSLDEAKEAEQGNADLAQSLKSTKGAAGMTMESLQELSESLSKNTTFEDDAVKSGESMLLTFTNIGKDVFPQATAAVLDFAQKMGTDPKQAALQLGKALNDPANGLSKLTKSGVTFTDQQKKQITAMQKSGDTAGAQKLMIQELNKEFGGQAAAAADTYAGKQKQIANQVKEVKEAIGTALMPVLAKLLKSITPIIQGIADFISKNPKLTAAILAAVAGIGILIGGISLLNTAMSLVAITQTVALGPILLVVAAIAALAAGAIAVVTHWQQVSGFFTNLWNTVRMATTTAWTAISQFFSQLWVNLGNGIKSAWTGFWTTISNLCNTIKNGIISAWNSVLAWFRALPGTLRTIGMNMFTSMRDGVTSTVGNVVSAVKTGIGAAIDWIKALPGEAIQWGADIINGIVNGIKNAASAVGDAVKGVAQNIRNFLHFSEPDEGPLVGFGTWMPDMMDLIVSGIKGNLGRVSSAANEVAATIAASIPTLDSSAQFHVALASASGYSATAPSKPSGTSTGSFGGVGSPTINQYFSGKVPTPSEYARQSRRSWQEALLKSKRG